jgi:hypothetical protein
MFGGSAAIDSAAAAPLQTAAPKQTGEASHLSARRSIPHHHRTIYQPRYQSYYYDRPVYYAPAPFFPFLGLGYGPWW